MSQNLITEAIDTYMAMAGPDPEVVRTVEAGLHRYAHFSLSTWPVPYRPTRHRINHSYGI